MTAQQIKVSIADDHKIFRDGIKMALRDREYLKILWEAEDGRDLMHKLKLKQPDVLLMDIRMPEVDGVNAIGMIHIAFIKAPSHRPDGRGASYARGMLVDTTALARSAAHTPF